VSPRDARLAPAMDDDRPFDFHGAGEDIAK
jgi:hypothetical protein